mgnify:CR=1 FL=1
MGNDPNKHINALGILDFFNKALIPAKLKFQSSSLGKNAQYTLMELMIQL